MPNEATANTAPALAIAPLLGKIFDGVTLARDEARAVMGQLMDGQLSQMQAAALLAALRTRGETVEEIVGFAQAMRQRAVKVTANVSEPLLDTCGTGGTGLDTINVSTASMFVAAAGGAKVAKHGNRGVTRKSGAADVLEALGVSLEQSPERLAQSLEQLGLVFIYARAHHPAMKFVAPIRADLKARTIFNSLGPLTNPAGATRQLMGVYDPGLTRTLAQVLAGLGAERAMVVHGDGIDELSVCGISEVSELLPDGSVTHYQLHPADVGLPRYALEDIRGGSPEDNAAMIQGILRNNVHGAKRDIVLLNAGAALYLADKASSLAQGVQQAATLIDSGQAAKTLDAYIAFSRS